MALMFGLVASWSHVSSRVHSPKSAGVFVDERRRIFPMVSICS